MSSPNIRVFRKLVLPFIPKPIPEKSKEDRRLINFVMWIMLCSPVGHKDMTVTFKEQARQKQLDFLESMKVFEEVYEDLLLAGTHVMSSRWVDTMKTPTMEVQVHLERWWRTLQRRPKVIYTNNYQDLWRPFLESLYVDTTQIGNKWDCWKSSAQSERRYTCGAIAVRSGLRLEGGFHGMRNLSAKWYRSLDRWENTIRETFWETIERTYRSVWFIGWVLPYFCEGPVKNPSIWKESLTWIVPWIRSVRGVNLEGWHIGCRHWGVGDDGRIGNPL